MSSKHSSCQEVGDLAIKFLGGLVLLCVANNVIALLCLPPPSFESKSVHRSKRKKEKTETEQEGPEPASSREGRRPKNAPSTHRSSSRPEATPRTHKHGSSRTVFGGGGGGSGVSRRGSRRAALVGGIDGNRPEPSSSTRRQQQHPQEEKRRRSGQPVASSRSPSPRGRHQHTPVPSKILILRTDSKGEAPHGSCGGGPPRGQVVYDARWLPCVLGEGGQATLLPSQQLRELCSRTPPGKRPGGASPGRVSKEVAE